MPRAHRHFSFVLSLVVLLLAACAGVPNYPGDRILDLTDRDFQSATQEETLSRIHGLFDHLQVPEDIQHRYAYMSGAQFQKADQYFEVTELSQTVLVAAKSVRVSFAKNAVIIAGGSVDIAHASGVVVISRGSIHISHGQSLGGVPGLFVTEGSADIGYATGASIYAVRGAQFSQTGAVSTYNTDIRGNLYGIAKKYSSTPIFHDEPVRAPESASMVVSSGESMNYKGTRCSRAASIHALADRLPVSARRELNCPRLDSIAVQCNKDDATGATSSMERWTFKGCGGTVHFDISSSEHTTSISPPIHEGQTASSLVRRQGVYATPNNATAKSPTPADRQKIAKDFQEGLSYLSHGELVKARAAYAKVLETDPHHQSAQQNIASLDARIARADAAAAPYSERIRNGDPTARTLADRGLAYFNAGDFGRGLADLDAASRASITDNAIAVDRAWAYLRANRLTEASNIARQLLSRYPRFAKAYEVRAWCSFLENRPDAAYKDAFSSLIEAGHWTTESFASEKAAYRLIVGYFALRQSSTRAKATNWIREWRDYLFEDRWPDAAALYLIGELDEREMMAVAEGLRSKDRGNAVAEAQVFSAIEKGYAGEWEASLRQLNETFRGPGPTLAHVIWTRLNTPGQGLRFR